MYLVMFDIVFFLLFFQNFDGIECEWPMFYIHLIIEGLDVLLLICMLCTHVNGLRQKPVINY